MWCCLLGLSILCPAWIYSFMSFGDAFLMGFFTPECFHVPALLWPTEGLSPEREGMQGLRQGSCDFCTRSSRSEMLLNQHPANNTRERLNTYPLGAGSGWGVAALCKCFMNQILFIYLLCPSPLIYSIRSESRCLCIVINNKHLIQVAFTGSGYYWIPFRSSLLTLTKCYTQLCCKWKRNSTWPNLVNSGWIPDPHMKM